jgi:ABC-type transport system involved in multi-copper enzyme maturation permease subunit
MSATLIVARHVVQESVRRRVFLVVFLLTMLFLGLFVLATVKAFAGPAPFVFGSGNVIDENQITSLTTVTLLGLGAFASLFLGTVLAVFLTLGAVRGDAERGLLQPLVVRPLGRAELLLGRFVGAVAVCVVYVTALYAAVVATVYLAGGQGPDHLVGPGLALVAAVTILVAMSLLGSVFLSATANGIAMFMLYGAGLVSGLLASVAAALGAHTLERIAHDIAVALPFEGLYQAGLYALGSNQTGVTRVLVNLGPFGSSHPGSIAFDFWSAGYLAIVAMIAIVAFERRDL